MQQQRLGTVDQELELRQVARVVIEEPIGAGTRPDIAKTVEHGKRIVVLQGSARARRRVGGRDVERRLGWGARDGAGSGRLRNDHYYATALLISVCQCTDATGSATLATSAGSQPGCACASSPRRAW